MKEHGIQNEIRNDLAGECLLFRVNVGKGWTGSKIEKVQGGKVLIHDARPFSTGLPPGFSDLFGVKTVTITQDMVGQQLGVFVAMEVKTENGLASELQQAFMAAINRARGIAGVVRSALDARKLLGLSK